MADLSVFRIVTQRHAHDAFSGEGARLYGGRWNPKGIRVVYTASSRALAMLEMLTQDQPLRARYVIIPATIPAAIQIERVALTRLPTGWSESNQNEALRAIGADWVKRSNTAVLCVPSAVVPSEFNYLLNPGHSNFKRIKIGKAEVIKTDARLMQKITDKTTSKRRER